MNQIIEFVGNHALLFAAFAATLGMLLYTEWTRIAGRANTLSPYAATQLVNDEDALFVDVRDEKEYKAGHLLNARNFPVASFDERLHEIEKFKERNLVVYCDNGMRTTRATAKLKKQGFENLHTLAGGLAAWEKASLPVVRK